MAFAESLGAEDFSPSDRGRVSPPGRAFLTSSMSSLAMQTTSSREYRTVVTLVASIYSVWEEGLNIQVCMRAACTIEPKLHVTVTLNYASVRMRKRGIR